MQQMIFFYLTANEIESKIVTFLKYGGSDPFPH